MDESEMDLSFGGFDDDDDDVILMIYEREIREDGIVNKIEYLVIVFISLEI